MEDLTHPVIKHGTLTRFIVKKGELGLGFDNNEPVFFEEGVYIKDSPLFLFAKCVAASDKNISLGAKKIITVWDGEVGVTYNKGKLIVLKPDRHVIDSTEHIFQGFISTQQQCLHLYGSETAKKLKKKDDDDDRLLICETKDFVEIGLKADVFYKIEQAEKVLMVVGKENVVNLVRDTAVATLNSIIRSTTLGEVAQNKEITAKSTKQHLEKMSKDPNAPSAPLFFDKVHDEFISKLHDSFLDLYGIAVTNIRIESFRIVNQELANNISQQAFVTAQTQNQLANLTGQTEIATAQQRRDAEVNRIKAEGEAVRLITETSAKNKAIMASATAEADATVIKARSESQSIELKADAEAKAVLLKAEAEAKRAEMLYKTPLGGQIQMYSMYSDMVRASMNGVEKVVYVPQSSGSDSGMNPLSFLAFQNMMGGVKKS
jgi:regulator of protease activity HflC (stomatin/prohibitin superfamily)